jgi:hypothetical protein
LHAELLVLYQGTTLQACGKKALYQGTALQACGKRALYQGTALAGPLRPTKDLGFSPCAFLFAGVQMQ